MAVKVIDATGMISHYDGTLPKDLALDISKKKKENTTLGDAINASPSVNVSLYITNR